MLTEKKKWNEIFRMVTALGLCVGISAAMPVRGLEMNPESFGLRLQGQTLRRSQCALLIREHYGTDGLEIWDF